ncbi:MAG: sigma-70 family RNA polymerase sigma factor [Planctomycetes bacterium]|nr:sigma-70 family RNA polymerase sigma factor [Planctomycetota bacterium]
MSPKASDIFDILIRQHADMLSAFIYSMSFDRSEVDDIFQETIISAWTRIDDFDPSRPFAPWLRGIARNHILAAARKNRRYRAHLHSLLEERVEEQFGRLDRESGDSFAERIAELKRCIARLHAEGREAIELVYIRGVDLPVAAESVGAADETFRKRLYRARLWLAECLKGKEVLA